MTAFPMTAGPLPTTCQINGEHHGDTVVKISGDVALETWTCCDEATELGEMFDCDTCLDPGIARRGQDMPTGWSEDANGFHCSRCTPPGHPTAS